MRRFVTVSVTILLTAGFVLAQKRGLIPEDFYKELTIQDTAVSPAGDLVAFTVMTVMEYKNKRHREIWLQRLANGVPDGGSFRLTSPTEEASSPRWSPDGSLLAFESRRGEDSNDVWFLRMEAGGGEAFHIEGVIGSPTWSPDGQRIAFTRRPDGGDEEDDGEEGEGWIAPDAITRTLDPVRFDGRVVTSMRYKSDGILSLRPHYSVRDKAQLFVVNAQGGEARQLTEMAFDVGGVTWTAEGQTLLFTGNEEQNNEYNRDQTQDIYAVSASGGDVRRLTTNPGSERSAAVSPDGTQLTFLYTSERGAETDVMLVDIAADGSFAGGRTNLTADWSLAPGALRWTRDGNAIRFTAGTSGNTHLFEASLQGQVRQITSGDRTLRSISAAEDGSVMAYALTDPLTPSDLYVSRTDGSGEQRLTSFNEEWLQEVDLMPAERLSWTVEDGTEIEGWLIKPVGYSPGQKYPLILKIHGGPHGSYGNYWFRTFHVLSNAGFFVLYPNPRGSSGYGHEFTYATRGQWGEMDQEDYLGGVDAAVARYAEIDADRVGVAGGSYGGYMTNWLTATTDRFAAAVTSRSITNWESWWGTSDAQGLTEYEFFGAPWEQRELYRRLSPISYVENVTAPTLIIHSENDYRTPIGDGEQWFMSLMKNRVPTELVRYPRSSHGLSRSGEPWLLVDRLERMRSWFVHWLIEEGVSTSQRERK